MGPDALLRAEGDARVGLSPERQRTPRSALSRLAPRLGMDRTSLSHRHLPDRRRLL
jgi:hypothetical protein